MMLVTLCGLQAQSSAQVHVGLSIGRGVAVQASVGPITFATGISNRVSYRPISYQPLTCAPIIRHTDVAPRRHVVSRTVWVPGHYELVEVPARYRTTIDPCGRSVRTLVHAARTERVFHRGRWEAAGRHERRNR